MSVAEYDQQINGLQNQIVQLNREIDEFEENIKALNALNSNLSSLRGQLESLSAKLIRNYSGSHSLFGIVSSIVKDGFFGTMAEAAQGSEYKRSITTIDGMSEDVKKKIEEFGNLIQNNEDMIFQIQQDIRNVQNEKAQFLESQTTDD